VNDEVRIVLVGAAKAAHDQMLAEILSDKRTSISSSKMMNWIAVDYFERFFKRRQKQLRKEHFNERKCFQEAMKIEDPAERRRALQEAARNLGVLGGAQRGRKKKAVSLSDNAAPETK
jgi:hypothetical protein